MNDVEFLQSVRAKIEKGWTQRAFARNLGKTSTHSLSSTAVSWCLVGAATAVDPSVGRERIWRLRIPEFVYNITEWNDDPRRTKEEVLEMIDRMITKAKDVR